jgi:hypothetical protein
MDRNQNPSDEWNVRTNAISARQPKTASTTLSGGLLVGKLSLMDGCRAGLLEFVSMLVMNDPL